LEGLFETHIIASTNVARVGVAVFVVRAVFFPLLVLPCVVSPASSDRVGAISVLVAVFSVFPLPVLVPALLFSNAPGFKLA